MPAPVLLAIESSQRVGSVALSTADGAIHEAPLSTDQRHDDGLMPAVDRLVREAGLAPRDLDAVALSIGPGGFTGLRIAVSTAKMLALTVGVALVPVPSAIVAATGADVDARPLGVALASKGATFWLTRLRRDGERWRGESDDDDGRLVDVDRAPLDDLALLLADEFLPAIARERCDDAGVPVVEPRLTARACLVEGRHRLAEGRTVAAADLLPLYPREPEAKRLWALRHPS